MMEFLEFNKLGCLDNGMADAAANRAINDAVQDLITRGREDGKARKAVFELEIYWLNGKMVAHLSAQPKLPPMRTSGTHCVEKAGKGGQSLLAFRDDNAENADQPTLHDHDN